MLYRVRANHLICVDLGVLGYVDDGEWFLELVIHYIRSLPTLRMPLPVTTVNGEVLQSSVCQTIAKQTEESHFPGNRTCYVRLEDYLKTLKNEYRRWKFDEMMESGSPSVVFDDLRPLLSINEQRRIRGGSAWDVVREYSNELISSVISGAVKEHFSVPMEMFMTAHEDKVSAFEVEIQFPVAGSSALDLKLWVKIQED